MTIGFVSLGFVNDQLNAVILDIGNPYTIELVDTDENTPFQIEMFRGDNLSQKCIVKSGGVVVDITDVKIYFTVKKKKNLSTHLIQKKNAAAGGSELEITMSDPVNGEFFINILPADTSSLVGDFKYDYDIQLVILDNTITPVRERFFLKQDITT